MVNFGALGNITRSEAMQKEGIFGFFDTNYKTNYTRNTSLVVLAFQFLHSYIKNILGLSIAPKGGLEVYVADSNESLVFRLVRDEAELKKALNDENRNEEDANVFAPEMSHQIYGDK